MKKIIKCLCAVVALFFITACSKVPVGHVGIKVYQLGGSKGVSEEELPVGRYWIGFNEQLFTFPTYTQTYVYTSSMDEGKTVDESIVFQTVESMTIHTNVGVTYHIDPLDVIKVFQKYREGVDEITHKQLRNCIRNSMISQGSKFTVERILGVDKAAFMSAVTKEVIAEMKVVGITIETVQLVGDLVPPDNIRNAINNKIQATQDAIAAENKIREAVAVAKRDSVTAAGHNKANHQLEQSLSAPLLQKMWIDKWDGHLPNTVTNASPFLGIPSYK